MSDFTEHIEIVTELKEIKESMQGAIASYILSESPQTEDETRDLLLACDVTLEAHCHAIRMLLATLNIYAD